jgi:hypothetical protein
MRAFLIPAAFATVMVSGVGATAADLAPPVVVAENVAYCSYLDFTGFHRAPCRAINWPGVSTGAQPGGFLGVDPNGNGPPSFGR